MVVQSLSRAMTDAEKFVAAARALVNKARWRHRGRTAWAVDCIGLIAVAARNCGLPFEDEENYGREPWEDQLRRGCRKRWGEPVAVADIAPGDILIVQWAKGEPRHIGIAGRHPYGWLTIIHSHNRMGVVEQSLVDHVLEVVIEAYRPWRSDVC